MDFFSTVNEVHPSLNDSGGMQSKSISNDTLSRLAKTVLTLKEDKKQRLKKVLYSRPLKAEEQKCNISAHLELLKKEKQDISGTADILNELRTTVLNYDKAPHHRLVKNLQDPSRTNITAKLNLMKLEVNGANSSTPM
ncbi:uncharacterized protein [Henckelia pumila]|uniref:uncharacterized protein isoform X1 n=1 Tax=Henckelia pumila TaxID=405737 RepID=UPI003C6E3F18